MQGSLGVALYKKKLVRFKERRRLQIAAAEERQQQDELLEMLRAEKEAAAAAAAAEAATERENAGLYGEEHGPDLDYYGDVFYDTERHDVPFATQHRLAPSPAYWVDEGSAGYVYDLHPYSAPFDSPHRFRRSPPEDGGDTAHDPDHPSIPSSSPSPLPPAPSDQPDEDEDDEALQKVLVNLAAQMDTSGCSLRFLCHLLGKPKDALTPDEGYLLRLFAGSHSDAPPASQCDQAFPRCGLQGEELSAVFSFTSGLVARIL